MNNAGSFFSLSLYEAMTRKPEDDESRDKRTGDGDRKAEEPKLADVRRQENKRSSKKSQKTKATRRETEESDEALILADELEEIKKNGCKISKRNHKASKVFGSGR